MKSRVLKSTVSAITSFLIVASRRLPSLQSAPPGDSTGAAITAVLAEQKAAWNRGDVGTFTKGYWDSPELTFAGSSGITRGWQPVLARYRKNYPDQKAMGHLDSSNLVLGRWHLIRETDELRGVFTLVFRRFPEGWRIIHDHTSLDAKGS